MLSFFISIAEKLLDWLIALRVKPTIKVVKFSITNALSDNKQQVSFTAIISNNSNKNMSISEKYLCFYDGKKQLQRIHVAKYELVRKNDGIDKLNILVPIDNIITLEAGESKEISVVDERENLSSANKIIFTYYTGRRTYDYKLKTTVGDKGSAV